MRAVACKQSELSVVERDAPMPGSRQLLIEVIRCGICGSDVHARCHADELADVAAEVGYDKMMRLSDEVIFGHEFCGVVAEHGPKTRKRLKAGTPRGGAAAAARP